MYLPLTPTIAHETIFPAMMLISTRQGSRNAASPAGTSAYSSPVFWCSCITCFIVSKSRVYIRQGLILSHWISKGIHDSNFSRSSAMHPVSHVSCIWCKVIPGSRETLQENYIEIGKG